VRYFAETDAIMQVICSSIEQDTGKRCFLLCFKTFMQLEKSRFK
jgi:hypothetical protein